MKRLTIVAVIAASLLSACGGASASPKAHANPRVHPPGWGLPVAPVLVQLAGPRGPVATMYDTVTLGTVPSSPFALAGYTSGFWPTYLPLRARYPRAHTISIAINVGRHADCLDVEPGDASPSQAPGWVRADKAAGFQRPCVYSSYWEYVNEIRPALARAGIRRSQVWEWSADYTYRPHIDSGFDATQWTDKALGRNLDASLVLQSFLSIAQPPLRPHPQPSPSRKTRIIHLRALARRYGCYRKHHRKPHACHVWSNEVKALGG